MREVINYNNPYWMVNFFTDFYHSRKGKRYSPDTPEYQYIYRLLDHFKPSCCYLDYNPKKKGEFSILSLDELDIPQTFKLRKFEIKFSTCNPIKGPFYTVNVWMVSNVIPNIIQYMDIYKRCIEVGNSDLIEENIDIGQCSYLTFFGDNNDFNLIILEDLANFAFQAYEPFHLPGGKFNKLLRKDAIKDTDEKIILNNILGEHVFYGISTKMASLIMMQSMFINTLIGNSLSVYVKFDTNTVNEYGDIEDFLLKDLDIIVLAGIERAIMKERKIDLPQASVIMKRAFFDYISPSYTAKDIEKDSYYDIIKLIDLIDFINKEELEKKPYSEAAMMFLDEFRAVFKNKSQIENH